MRERVREREERERERERERDGITNRIRGCLCICDKNVYKLVTKWRQIEIKIR